jgi:leucyl aminopeptidase
MVFIVVLRAAREALPSIVTVALGASKRISDNSAMPSTTTSAPITCVSSPLHAIDTDLLVVPWFEEEGPSAIDGLDAASGGDIGRALASKEFSGKAFELFATSLVDRSWRARRVVLIGGGQSADCYGELARQLAAAAGISVRNRRVQRVGLLLRGRGDVAELAQAVAEGLTLSEFNVGIYKTGEAAPPGAPAWTVAMPDQAPDVLTRARAAVDRGRLLAECSNLARELANEPGNRLTPR